jgi:tRNA(Ile)-lysidine synthase
MALCWLLSRWSKEKKGPVLHALTVDHRLRADSAVEARRVGRWVKGWPQVQHKVLTLKGTKSGKRLMETARAGRYDALAAYCRRHKISYLFLAHHQDDQAETFLFRLAKGSGPDGLGGMRVRQDFDDKLTLVRPLLGISKERLVGTCRAYDIPFVEDPTNANPAFARNRLRQAREVLAGEGLTAKRLGVTASRLRRACDALEHYTEMAFRSALRNQERNQEKGRTVFDFSALAAEPEDIRLRVLLKVMGGEGYGPRREKMEALATDLFSGHNFRKRTLGGFIIEYDRRNKEVRIEKEKK